MGVMVQVARGSLAERLGMISGDCVVSINGARIRDEIDYRFHASDALLRIRLRRNGQSLMLEAEKEPDEDLGLVFKPLQLRRCRNHCIFCFAHQLPKRMRRRLYFKDDDYRLSFLKGAYVTLTNLSEEDLSRIIRQRLHPLYISVHATEPDLRGRMLGKDQDFDVLVPISRLAEAGMEMHTQVVLCPGINDGHHLERTVRDLSRFFPQVRSVAVVPVGLTRYRDHLTALIPVDAGKARMYLAIAERWQRAFERTLGTPFVYLSDEFYLLAGEDPPPYEHYAEFPQIENGVGMVRSFLDEYDLNKSKLPRRISPERRIVLVTGKLAARFMGDMVRDLNEIEGLTADLISVENRFFGERITVSGLLTGRDIGRALGYDSPWDAAFLPPNCLNDEGVFLDDVKVEEIESDLRGKVLVSDYNMVSSIRAFLSGEGLVP